MDGQQNLEEEIDTLECIYNNLDSVSNMLKSLSSDGYNVLISQCQELLNDVDYLLIDKQDAYDLLDENQLVETRLERYEREIEYKKIQI